MKKILFMLVVMTVCLCGCGKKEADTGNTTKKENTANEIKGYVFETKGITIAVDMKAEPVIDKLGEPVKYQETESCAFQGLDKVYQYSSFEIITYQIEGVDYISSINLLDDLVTTKEGVSLFMKEDEVVSAYGEKKNSDADLYIYEKDGMELRIGIENGEVAYIDYVSKVLD